MCDDKVRNKSFALLQTIAQIVKYLQFSCSIVLNINKQHFMQTSGHSFWRVSNETVYKAFK